MRKVNNLREGGWFDFAQDQIAMAVKNMFMATGPSHDTSQLRDAAGAFRELLHTAVYDYFGDDEEDKAIEFLRQLAAQIE